MPNDNKNPYVTYDEADYKKLKDLVNRDFQGTPGSYTSPDFQGTRTDTGKPIYLNEQGKPIVYQNANDLTPVATYDKKALMPELPQDQLDKLTKANEILKKKQEDRLSEYIKNQVGVQATTPEEIKKAQTALKEGESVVPGYSGRFSYVGSAQSVPTDAFGKPLGDVHYNLSLVPEELQANIPVKDQSFAKSGEAYKDYITGYSQYQDETGKPFYIPQFGLPSKVEATNSPRNIYKDKQGVYFTQNPDGTTTSIPFTTAEQQLRNFPNKIQEIEGRQKALQGRVDLANKLLTPQAPLPDPGLEPEKFPFGGLINRGVTGLAKKIGLPDKTAQMIGSGVATATGFIPGMQDNLFQGVDLAGDALKATGNTGAENVGNTLTAVQPLLNMLSYQNGGPLNNSENLTKYNGMPHEMGGLPLGNTGNEVEDGETRNGDFIFSERIKLPWNKKRSFADESKRIEGKYKDRKGDKFATEAMQRELDMLKGKQEEHKQKMQAKMQKMHEMIGSTEMKYGGKMKYQTGGDLEPMNVPESDPYAMSPYRLFPMNAPEATLDPYSEQTFRLAQDRSMETDMPEKQGLEQNQLQPLDYISAAVPTLTRAATLIGGPKETKFEQFTPQYVNLQSQRDALKRQSDIAKTQGSRMIGEQSGGSGNALSNLVAMNAAINQSQGEQLGQSYLNEQLQNTGIGNQAGMFNTQMQNQETIANEQNQANFMNQLIATGDTFAGTMSGLRKDNRLYNANNQYNQMGIENLNSLFPNYQYQLGQGWEFKGGQ